LNNWADKEKGGVEKISYVVHVGIVQGGPQGKALFFESFEKNMDPVLHNVTCFTKTFEYQ
jgi:hypothetical protein